MTSFTIHHIGIATPHHDKTLEGYKMLGAAVIKDLVDDKRHVRLSWLKIGENYLEIISPVDDSSPVGRIVKNGVAPYHICFQVDDIGAAIEKLRLQGFLLIEPPSPAVLFDNKRVAFLYSKSVGLIELVEG